MTDRIGFGGRLATAFAERGRLCVGIDPHADLLDRWGLPDTAEGAREFGLRVVGAVAGRAGIVKPQVAFFERHGAAGYAALERVLAEARDARLVIIADAKRGDIGTSVAAYGEAWLTPGSPLEADAMTISAYQGLGSIEPVRRQAEAAGKGLLVLAATSNPEARPIQGAVLQESSRAGATVAGAIVSGVSAWNRETAAPSGIGSMGVVIGATVDLVAAGIEAADDSGPALPVLAPGFGHQGAEPADFRRIFGGLADGVIVSESRSVLAAGPDGIADEILRRLDLVGAARG
ncbi:orotidine-5'-phosphate decarboxylase [Agromyces larvae]|uniref:Orotidine-5'-phosphate decarboxylase n=1 Tax=Agromyces larvae TaxID=2929802 RepID=A0ABY4C2I9_9MICO|nr:orotidine-5'-phosphate decarboxylase [Agromyces larvae]UOE45209.1 orotidine-5'-phosphate decarboxylase [Agromyces larvae]